jgi:hypothetical protein
MTRVKLSRFGVVGHPAIFGADNRNGKDIKELERFAGTAIDATIIYAVWLAGQAIVASSAAAVAGSADR